MSDFQMSEFQITNNTTRIIVLFFKDVDKSTSPENIISKRELEIFYSYNHLLFRHLGRTCCIRAARYCSRPLVSNLGT